MKNNYWNKTAETMSRDELAALQLERLQKLVARVYDKSPFYKSKFDKAGVKPGDIKSLEDLSKLPTIDKTDFRDQYPLGMLSCGRDELAEMHMSSGSTGDPVVMAYTENDLVQWGECMSRCYYAAGLVKGDAVQITPSLGLFNGGFGFYHGCRLSNMFIIPTSSGNTPRQIKLMNDFKVRGLAAVVSYAVRIMEVMQETGQEIPSLEVGIFGAETFSDGMREKLEKGLGIEAFDIYGMTETGGVSTTGMDCKAHNGIHVWEDQYICEIINPYTGEPVPDGEIGEVVFTSLTREAIPIIRFRTGDLTRIISRDKCDCGRTGLRLDKIQGRRDDMLIIKGVNFFPKQVEQALLSIPGVGNTYQIIIENHHGVKDVRVNVEAEEGVTGYMVEKKLKETLGFSPKGDVYKIGELPRQEGKAVRVFYEED